MLPDCTRAAVDLPELFLNIFALQKKVNGEESYFVYVVSQLWINHPEMQPQLSRHDPYQSLEVRHTKGAGTSFSEEKG